MKNAILFALLLLLLLVGFSISYQADLDMAEYREQNYRDMVCLWRLTDGDAGWPNYRESEVKCEEVQ
jgi:hypothetical protein